MRSPAGCNKSFIEDDNGNVPCRDEEECPQNAKWWIENYRKTGNYEVGNGVCYNSKCLFIKDPKCSSNVNEEVKRLIDANFYIPIGWENGSPPTIIPRTCLGSFGTAPTAVSPVAGISITSSCTFCQNTSCPPNKPCRAKSSCYRPRCTRRGKCVCPF